jgi:hypothetical protein
LQQIKPTDKLICRDSEKNPLGAGNTAPQLPVSSVAKEIRSFLQQTTPSSTLTLKGVTPEVLQLFENQVEGNPLEFPSLEGLR